MGVAQPKPGATPMTNLETVRLFLVASPDHAAAARRLGRRLQQETHLRGKYAQDVADCLIYHQAHPEALCAALMAAEHSTSEFDVR